MAAPPDVVRERIVDLHRWQAWSPWEGLDPALRRTYGGAASGVGAWYAWEGNRKAGTGRMEIIGAEPGAIHIDLRFLKPFRSHSTTEFELEADDNGTLVTWRLTGPNTVMTRVMGVFTSMDRVLGPDFEKGLARLKADAESLDPTPDPTAATTSTGTSRTPTAWLPADFVHPTHVPLPTGHHLRPIAETDVDLDMVAVMSSRRRLWSIYGRAWGWPPADMTAEQDRADLARHAAEMDAHESFNYALFDPHETALLGCVYIDPPEKVGADAEISWWVVDECLGTDLEAALDSFVPRWIAEAWPLEAPRYVGRDMTWDDWLTLPDAT